MINATSFTIESCGYSRELSARLKYQFNNEGNQVSYRCDVKRVTTINFDRNKIRKMCADLSKKSDETSAALDAALVNTPVEYEAPFDVNETFAEAFEAHMSALS